MLTTLIGRTLRVPTSTGAVGDGRAEARRLDAALVQVGFKASKELVEHVAGLRNPAAYTRTIVDAVRRLVGDDVRHNPYFKDFPHGVPDTVEFWAHCLRDALLKNVPADEIAANGVLNLLALPEYGTRRHTYEELLQAHDALIPSVKDRVTVLHLGGTEAEETRRLYLELATSSTPLNPADLELLGELAQQTNEWPVVIPVRENRAVINAARLVRGLAVRVDTVTDVLRLACRASGGDVTLVEPTRFRSFCRPERRLVMAALDEVVAENPGKLGDVRQRREAWKRLGERVHPHEYRNLPHAQDVFAVARGNKVVRSFAGRAELAFSDGDIARATEILKQAPGMLLRQVDRLLRNASEKDVPLVVDAVREAVPAVSGRVLCSLLQHLENREEPEAARVFATRHRRAWITYDTRMPLACDVVRELTAVLEDELVRRLPEVAELTVADEVRDVVLPLSGNASEDGFGVLPRGSKVRLEGDLLRFFVYWREKARSTDYDLSAVLLNGNFDHAGQVSWTNYEQGGAYYSGDLTSARDGATEFIDVPRRAVKAKFVVPQVNIFGGEGFTEVAESMFGFMSRELDQRGRPFEPSTVRARSAMRGYGNVAVPVVFERTDDAWVATWLHLYLRGTPWANRVEDNRDISRQLARGVLSRRYFTVGRLAGLMRRKTAVDGLRLHVDLTNVDQLDKLLEPMG
ncbi:TerD family protein [Nocardia sp. NRRL S-836]|uniref:TerD family protein n=1 Tax=Nocardia sp. NRRL S-836 TaxID=1519492 RepID=UPI0006AFD747|nr:TerD family protein [Nocardia sp. NRRL S-836]